MTGYPTLCTSSAGTACDQLISFFTRGSGPGVCHEHVVEA